MSQQTVTVPGISQQAVTAPGISQQAVTAPGMPQQAVTAPGMPQQSVTAPSMLPQAVTAPGMSPQAMTAPGMSPQAAAAPGMSPQTVTAPGMSPQGVVEPDMSLQGVVEPDMSPQGIAGPGRPPEVAAASKMSMQGTTSEQCVFQQISNVKGKPQHSPIVPLSVVPDNLTPSHNNFGAARPLSSFPGQKGDLRYTVQGPSLAQPFNISAHFQSPPVGHACPNPSLGGHARLPFDQSAERFRPGKHFFIKYLYDNL